ncbi:folylpolyglutamate synthase/dihydrofolate synthase family protein [Dyadobacter sp. CY323]|uniref:bifunctional folylpolyglutamate synthase/dihydrofolate synthase n=1 Tax=Dyadobacter sp. CY323 TaxID=2907302 RepID=UPI001F2CD371|nr:folylpolyglutamate synthase/dihydrofolate synthase family protein [Dyadobacter sp. CY323]MCE6992171.1 bifunctional folylpolyglutamate synthase/dihydrofolate synthase [Dyadobacter sp. CY323]
MNYQETIDYLYSRLPVFQNIGARAFKPGLYTTQELCRSLGDPQNKYRTIHVAGTNGKGSTSHMLAAILQQAGYRVGLYTSPHLKDFRERIRVNGAFVSEDFIVQFTAGQKSNIESLNPSFFEVTVAMAFDYFAQCNVDVAVIEVGMGGRLDSTNVITPEVSVITNISYDHMQFLGDTLPLIASEKAGIIKEGVPVVISEYQNEEVSAVLTGKANEVDAPLSFSSERFRVESIGMEDGRSNLNIWDNISGKLAWAGLELDLTGSYQTKNIAGVLSVVEILKSGGWSISEDSVYSAMKSVVKLTGLKGRWQLLQTSPVVYCDTAHNSAGLSETIEQFEMLPHTRKRFVLGFVGDKDITGMLKLFPVDADYYFCQPSNTRALNVSELSLTAAKQGLFGKVFGDVNEALNQALSEASSDDIIYVGGSTFVVADLKNL